MNRTARLALLIANFTAAQCLAIALDLRATAFLFDRSESAAGIWFEAADVFERIVTAEDNRRERITALMSR